MTTSPTATAWRQLVAAWLAEGIDMSPQAAQRLAQRLENPSWLSSPSECAELRAPVLIWLDRYALALAPSPWRLPKPDTATPDSKSESPGQYLLFSKD